MRLIDADELRAWLVKAGRFLKLQDDKRTASHAIGKIIDHVDKTPAVDAVSVVRCRNCKHWNEETGWCDIHSHFQGSDGEFCHPWESNDWKVSPVYYFCADGERVAKTTRGDENGQA